MDKKIKQKLEALLKNEDRNAERRKHRGYSNIDVFNRWRKLRWVEDYYGLDLRGIDLVRADLKGINLENVHLHDFNITYANLEGANLRRASLDYTDAIYTNFKNADLRDCGYFYKLGAHGANFEGADLRGARLDKKYEKSMQLILKNAHFSGTKITPEQKEQLIADFGIPENYFEGRFKVIPRSKYLGPHAWFFKKGLKAYEKAKKEGRISTEKFKGDTLEYAVIPVQGNEDLHDRYGYAFSICKPHGEISTLFGTHSGNYHGDWRYLVFDTVPEQFREFAAVHEFGERKSGGVHKEAVKVEYERAKSKGLLPKYVSWISQNDPRILINNMILVEGIEEVLPSEVVEETRKIFPQDIEAYKKQQENKKHGLPADIWELVWKKGGLNDRQISEMLAVKGYNVSQGTVRYHREKMEIPNYSVIKKLTFLEPFK